MNTVTRSKIVAFVAVVICLTLGIFLATMDEPAKLFAGMPPQQTGPAPTNTPLPGTPRPTVVFSQGAIPHLGLVLVQALRPQPVYEDPSGGVVRNSDGSELWIPNDADHSGFDTYVVTGSATVGSRIWVQIYLGSSNFVWIPLDKALAVTSLDIE